VKRLKGRDLKKGASHNTPVTVAAEPGLRGLGLFLWLVVAVFVQAFRRPDVGTLTGRVSLVAGLGVAAILCHSLFYNDFFEDPTTWLLLGLVAFALPPRHREEELPPAVEAREAVPA